VKVLTVTGSAIGAKGKFSYSVLTESAYAPAIATDASSVVDETKTVTFDVSKPALTFSQGGTSGVLFADAGNLTVTRASGVTSAKVLALHLGNAAGSQADVSTIKVTPPTLALKKGSAVTISGTAKVGATLTAKPGTWAAKATYKYQWLRDGKAITTATGSKYTLTSSAAGHRFSVKVTAHASGYKDGTATSRSTAKVARR